MHDFREKLTEGQKTEHSIMLHVLEQFEDTIGRHATMQDERRGIDIWLKRTDDGALVSLQVKSDSRMQRTGNFFIETWSVWPQKKGWIWTTEADTVCYVDEGDWSIYWLSMPKLKAAFCAHWQDLREVSVPNDGYTTKGILVPKQELIHRLNPLITNLEKTADDDIFSEPELDFD